ncbi:DUF6429 family protein [Neobacillus sp. FSL H8-0543]|uniref:DUF6429 family protein n=1 Tax=Neobacillus sp. FSL H8-0543 TaxID=2954672 RepID=UPI003158ED41
MHLTSFPENYGLGDAQRSWKGYPFDSLNELTENDYIRGSKQSKSVYLAEKGIEQA